MTKTPEQMAEEYVDNRPALPSCVDNTTTIRMQIEGYDAFLAGYQAAKDEINSPEKQDSCEHILDMEKMVDVNSSSGWISAYERLPKWHKDVLAYTVFNSFREIKVIRYEPNYGFDFNGIVTHWMPLPAAPKEEA